MVHRLCIRTIRRVFLVMNLLVSDLRAKMWTVNSRLQLKVIQNSW